MLPQENRLRRSRDFARVRRFGRSAGSPLAIVYVLPTRNPQVRVGFSVSKRVGKATVRNRVKRLLREAVRQRLPVLLPAHDLVFIARPAAREATYEQIVDTVAYLSGRTSAVCAPNSDFA